MVVFFCLLLDHQKLEREARICRLLKHPNIGKCPAEYSVGILWQAETTEISCFCVWSYLCP
jgi:hypothetical protein